MKKAKSIAMDINNECLLAMLGRNNEWQKYATPEGKQHSATLNAPRDTSSVTPTTDIQTLESTEDVQRSSQSSMKVTKDTGVTIREDIITKMDLRKMISNNQNKENVGIDGKGNECNENNTIVSIKH